MIKFLIVKAQYMKNGPDPENEDRGYARSS